MANKLALDILRAALASNYWGWANLRGADLRGADLREANLRGAYLSGAELGDANLGGADLRWADLREANLRGANLSGANLREANLRGANLRGADLSGADLSGAAGLLNPVEWLKLHFKFEKTLKVFKAFKDTSCSPNPAWKIEENSVIEEEPNYCRADDCGCGINFGTLEFIRANYPNSEIWECEIEPEWFFMVVVPYNTDGKARCGKMRLLKKLEA